MTSINNTESAGELSRLDHQAGLVSQAIGLIPHELRGRRFQRILDLGCGSGRWAVDAAYRYPDAEVIGVDISQLLVDYARARARTTQRDNLRFIEWDALKGNLDIVGKERCDLIHLRFGVGWVPGTEGWVRLINRCYELNSIGGSTVVTEGEGLYTSSAPLRRLYEILVQALGRGGYGLSPSERETG